MRDESTPLDYESRQASGKRLRWKLPLCSIGSLFVMALSNRLFLIFAFFRFFGTTYINWLRGGRVTDAQLFSFISGISYALLGIGTVSALVCWYVAKKSNARGRRVLMSAIIALLAMYWVAPIAYAVYFWWGFSPH